MIEYDVVIPTIGRASLTRLISSLGEQRHRPTAVQVVHDDAHEGPATARNRGWRNTSAPWVVFLDDDVVLPPDWSDHLVHDLEIDENVGAVQGRIVVPDQPEHPSDDDLATIALESASCVTADLAVRRSALESVEGFDERLPRAYREDTDFALRLLTDEWAIAQGSRTTLHPLRRDSHWYSSIARQRGNVDDAFMRRRHGTQWRDRAGVPRGALPLHLLATGGLALAACGPLFHRRALTITGTLIWAASTTVFLMERLSRTSHAPTEVMSLLITSVAIPPVAVAARAVGEWRHREVEPVFQEEPV